MDSGAGAGGADGATSSVAGNGGVAGDQDLGGGGALDEPGVAISRYDYRLDLASREAESTLTFDVTRSGSGCVNLKSSLPVRDTLAPLGFELAQRADELALCGSFTAGNAVQLSTKQTVIEAADPKTQVGFSRRPDRANREFSYLLGWLEQCPRFGPCDPAPQRLTHYTFDVSHATADVVLCPGVRTFTEGSTHCELLDTLAPSYSSFAIASDSGWARTPLVTAAGVSVVLYDTPAGSLYGGLDAASFGDFLEWLTQLLGPYPYGDELRVASAPTTFLGMEHPANIVVRDDLTNLFVGYSNVPMHVLLHETVHQWAGNRTTLSSTLDYLWKEAIAEYLAYVFEDERRPFPEAMSARSLWHNTGLGAPYPIRPLTPPPLPLEDWAAGGYDTAPLALFVQLEPWLGRPAVLAAIQLFLRDPVARSMDDLRAALETTSRLELANYFAAWVFGDEPVEWPVVSATVQQTGSEATVTLTQSQSRGRIFPCVIDVELKTANETAVAHVDFGLSPSSTSAAASVVLDEPVVSVSIDPERRVLVFPAPAAAAAPAAPPTRLAPRVPFHP